MTKKDYIRIASIFKSEHDIYTNQPDNDIRHGKMLMWRTLVNSFVDSLYEDNPRFDSDKFYSACGVLME